MCWKVCTAICRIAWNDTFANIALRTSANSVWLTLATP